MSFQRLAPLFALLIAACGDPTASSSSAGGSGKADGLSVCAADEPVIACIVDSCPDLVGDEFDDCFTDNCEDIDTDATVECGLCMVDGFEAGMNAEEIAERCATPVAPPPTEESGACGGDELVLQCIVDQCPDLVGDDFDTCFEDNCEQFDDITTECGFCMVTVFEQGGAADDVLEQCTSAAGPGFPDGIACKGDDTELLACIATNCAGDDSAECVAMNCSGDAQQTSVPCLVCVESTLVQGGAAADIESTCTSDDSAPCSVATALDMQHCATNDCAGLEGDPLDECMANECPDVFDNASESCGQCVIGLNQSGVPFGDAAAHCGG